MADIQRVVTGRVRLSFVNVFKPRPPMNGQQGDPKYSVTVLLPKSDTVTKAKLDAAVEAAAQEGVHKKWQGKRPPKLSVPIHDGDGVRENGDPFGPECKGCWVFTASSKDQPGIVDAACEPIMNQSEVYSGCYGRVSFRAYPYDAAGKRGIGLGLGNVQKLEDGEPLAAGQVSADRDFGSEIDPITGEPKA